MPDMWMDVDIALAEVPVNLMPLIDDTDFKTRETGVLFNAAGMDLVWNFVTPAGAMSQTAVTPTDGGGDYDWAHQGDGMYSIGIVDAEGASINNDADGFGWFTGYCTGVLPWRGPVIGFRAGGLNNLLIEDAYSATRGLAGTALPNVAADDAGGLPISDAGGLDLDTQLANTNEVTAARMGALTDWINGGRLDNLLDAIPTTAMRGTDGANTTTPPTAAANRAEMDASSTQLAAIVEDTGTTLPALIAALDPAASSTINGQGNVGDYKSDATVIIKWDTKGIAATSVGDVRIYFNGGTEEITVPTGVTDTRAFDGLTGVNHLSIDLSANDAYRKDRDYAAVLVGMVIGGQTVNVILGTWSIEKRNQGAGFIKDS